jgi:hypothetical protein
MITPISIGAILRVFVGGAITFETLIRLVNHLLRDTINTTLSRKKEE